MFIKLTLFLFWIVLITVVIHYIALFRFLHRFKRTKWKRFGGEFVPKTMVFLPLRGADPSLPGSLERVLTQDYPNYHVQFLFDAADDPALPYVEAAMKKCEGQSAEIVIVKDHFATCSLKNSVLYNGVRNLDSSFEVVVLLDADTNPPSGWLKELVEPLSDAQFPAATGLRWYVPAQPNSGSLVRYLWNAAAVVQQELYQIPWGGSLALRRDFLTEGDLLERWKHSIADDTPIRSAVQQSKGNVAVVSSLFLVNREHCGLRSFHRWVKRQMLMAKLYHPAWGAILGQAVLITLPLVFLSGTFFAGLIQQDGQVVLWSLISFFLYWAGVFGTLPIMERAVRQTVQRHGERVERWPFSRTLLTFAMVPVTQGVYISALFRLHFLRRVEWRGIWYEIGKDKTVKMIEYVPYAEVCCTKSLRGELTSL